MIVAVECREGQAAPRALSLVRAPRPARSTDTHSSSGVLLRPIGNVVYFMPPYIVDEAQMDLMVRVAAEGIELATCD